MVAVQECELNLEIVDGSPESPVDIPPVEQRRLEVKDVLIDIPG